MLASTRKFTPSVLHVTVNWTIGAVGSLNDAPRAISPLPCKIVLSRRSNISEFISPAKRSQLPKLLTSTNWMLPWCHSSRAWLLETRKSLTVNYMTWDLPMYAGKSKAWKKRFSSWNLNSISRPKKSASFWTCNKASVACMVMKAVLSSSRHATW